MGTPLSDYTLLLRNIRGRFPYLQQLHPTCTTSVVFLLAMLNGTPHPLLTGVLGFRRTVRTPPRRVACLPSNVKPPVHYTSLPIIEGVM